MLQSGIIELDVHSMNRAQAKTYIDSQLKRAKKDIYQIKVIHGYRGGTAIRDMVRKTYRNHPKVVRVELPLNPGETNLILKCQAMCLEEMLHVDIPKGALYYNETHRREEIAFTASMRENVESMLREMHNYYRQGYTPNVKPKKGCSLCSLKDICLPVICRKTVVADYYAKFLNEDAL